jgi:hypothetical protein
LIPLLTLSLHLLCEMQDVVGVWSVVLLVREESFARCANAHLRDDEAVAKMGHPNLFEGLDLGHPSNQFHTGQILRDPRFGNDLCNKN